MTINLALAVLILQTQVYYKIQTCCICLEMARLFTTKNSIGATLDGSRDIHPVSSAFRVFFYLT